LGSFAPPIFDVEVIPIAEVFPLAEAVGVVPPETGAFPPVVVYV